MQWYEYVAIAGVALIALILLRFCIKWTYSAWLRYEAGKDRSYNVFDKAELSWGEKRELHSWKFMFREGLLQSPKK